MLNYSLKRMAEVLCGNFLTWKEEGEEKENGYDTERVGEDLARESSAAGRGTPDN